ncbi:hypothetical protein ACFS2C_15990 [Prauserella oleivorans]|uniref:Phosphodiesterase n=1 Tax=Prauserella oleivorans TaxID=1478153 RepID=A0ABW5WA85_9PSEU
MTTALEHGVRSVVDRAAATASRLRRARAFHPAGVLLTGDLELTARDAAPAVAGVLAGPTGERFDVLGRLSKGAGTPGEWPDVLGLAVRLPGPDGTARPVDLLFSTTGNAPVLRCLPQARADWRAGVYSSTMPYRIAGSLCWFGAHPDPGPPIPSSTEALRLATAAAPLVFTLAVAAPLGPWLPIARLSLTAAPGEPGGEAFDSMRNAHPALRPAPRWLAALREQAYVGSRRGRGGPPA